MNHLDMGTYWKVAYGPCAELMRCPLGLCVRAQANTLCQLRTGINRLNSSLGKIGGADKRGQGKGRTFSVSLWQSGALRVLLINATIAYGVLGLVYCTSTPYPPSPTAAVKGHQIITPNGRCSRNRDFAVRSP